tara:strand:- start:1374 stop:1889 length:516 start_codon:yes stop_codon:yes gene_type:complete
MNYLKISFGIFLALAISRFMPHPPNFTSLLALSFYVPAILGIRFIPALVACFIITDYFIGFHSTVFFTWGSIVFIGLLSRHLNKNILKRVFGALAGACIFFIITNFGVWSFGSYGYSIEGFLLCYTLAIPFFTYSLISTFIFAGLIESVFFFYKRSKLFEHFKLIKKKKNF